MKLAKTVLVLLVGFTANVTMADEEILGSEADNQTQEQANVQFDNQVYRGGNSAAALVDPWAVPRSNLDDSQMLEEQMDPNPTIEYDQQLD